MPLFKDREEACKKLISTLPISKMKKEEWVVLAISSGGVYFTREIASIIGADVDYLFTEKITAPNNKDCTIAMISETEEIVINHNLIESFDITLDYMYGEAKRKYDEQILSYLYRYRKGELISSLNTKNILLVDEGADTGMTLMASLKSVIEQHANKVIVALPVVPKSIANEVEKIVDEVYFLHLIKNYVNMHLYYEELPNMDLEFL